MRVPYHSNPNVYDDFFKNQVGRGLPVYIGRGGLGNVLSGLFRSIVPIMKRGGKALLKEGVRSAVGVGQDILTGRNFKTAVKRRAVASGKRLTKKALRHAGILVQPSPKPKPRARARSVATRKRIKRSRGTSRRSQSERDIFG